ncbi:MAG: copper chaperone PCu(A)C [Betaproteobacteria bacterium]
MRTLAPVLLALALTAAGAADAAPLVANAWMRPAAAGAASADAYADVITETPLTLARVRTPVARAVEIVLLDPRDSAAMPRVVDKLELKSGETRFALRGSVLRLVGVNSALTSERPVPLAFEFVDGAGAKTVVETLVQVRGLVAPAAK